MPVSSKTIWECSRCGAGLEYARDPGENIAHDRPTGWLLLVATVGGRPEYRKDLCIDCRALLSRFLDGNDLVDLVFPSGGDDRVDGPALDAARTPEEVAAACPGVPLTD